MKRTRKHADRLRVLIAPTEVGGQMQLLAETLRRQGHLATSLSYRHPDASALGYINDVTLDYGFGSGRLSLLSDILLLLPFLVRRYDVFHFFYGQSLLPKLHWDLPLLRRMGKRIIVHFRGSDIVVRGPSVGVSSRDDILTAEVQLHERGKQLLKMWRRYADALLVSTPDLKQVVPDAKMVQQAIDLNKWNGESSKLQSGSEPIRVAHAPTNRAKKGTDVIVASIEELRSHGHPVELVLIEDMSPLDAKRTYQTCHIAVDQLLIGWYGNFAVEMMALCRPVIGYINPQFKKETPDLPIVSATPRNLTAVLERLLCAHELRVKLGEEGRRYVEKRHGAEGIVDQLISVYSRPKVLPNSIYYGRT